MRKIAIILIMCATSLVAMADGWQYGSGIAVVNSSEEYFSNDFDNPTFMRIIVSTDNENLDIVMVGVEGYQPNYHFRRNQEYVVADFDGIQSKWAIEKVNIDEKPVQYFYIKEATKFIEVLKKYDYFTITLPLLFNGNTTFHFYTNGYPLDW